MRLINTTTLELEEYHGEPPEYAILSHTWGNEEVTFQDWQENFERAKQKEGFSKIHRSCAQAWKDGYDYLWCDTNCIDKTSSAELSEAINSMFSWYKGSAVCYAYLGDVPPISHKKTKDHREHFARSRWFTRGWTLQELLAPSRLIFFDHNWEPIGSRSALSKEISSITRVGEEYFQPDADMGSVRRSLSTASVSERMSWLSRRKTTRVEDLAYCMLGIFDVNIPLLYGEGHKAFIRLQEEILRVSNDHTIFCWTWDPRHVPSHWASMLSPSPRTFEDSGSYSEFSWRYEPLSYAMTNAGLSIKLPLLNQVPHSKRRCLAIVDVRCEISKQRVAIPLVRLTGKDRYRRSPFPPCPMPILSTSGVKETKMYVSRGREHSSRSAITTKNFRYGVVITCRNGALPDDSIACFPELEGGILRLNPLGPGRFGRIFGIAATPGLSHDHEDRDLAALVFFGVRVRDSKTQWSCKVVGIEVLRMSLDLDLAAVNAEKKFRSDPVFLNFAFGHGRENACGAASFESLTASVVIGAGVRIDGPSFLAAAQIQLTHISSSAGVAPWRK